MKLEDISKEAIAGVVAGVNPVAGLVVSVLLKYGPDAARLAHKLLSSKEPTDEEFQQLFAKAQEPWVDYVPVTQVLPVVEGMATSSLPHNLAIEAHDVAHSRAISKRDDSLVVKQTTVHGE